MKNLTTLLFFATLFIGAKAQTIPNNSNIKTGTLSNGMTYYIKENGNPRNTLELRLVVKVGSIVEDDDQQGLAHFLEHMGFNGTKNFEKNELIKYLQSIGVKFGAHLNASTGFDKTVYQLTMPSDKKAEVEKGFQILEDWAFNMLLSNEEIEKERGVIIEEYRTGLGAENRMQAQYFSNKYYHSRYSERMPIGKKEIIENFEPESLRRFYKDWYRPDLMAVIAVGDISVAELEAQIIKHFDKAKKVEKPRERIYYPDESHQKTLISIVSDYEATENQVSILYKNPETQAIDNSAVSQEKKLKEQLFSILINNRFKELANSNKPPFIKGIAQNVKSLIKNKETYTLYAKVISNDYLLALKTLLTENERIKKFGFSTTEFQRAKESLALHLKHTHANSRHLSSNNYVALMQDHFLDGTAMPSSGWVNNFNQTALPQILIEDVEALIKKYLRNDNRFVLVSGKEKLVSEKEITDLIFEVENNKNIKPYVDIVVAKELFSEKLEPAKIVSEEKNEPFNITTITLSNGVKVQYKKRRYGSHVIFESKSKGGTSLHSTADFFESYHALEALKHAGIGGFSKNELDKLLAGNTAKVYPAIYHELEMMSGYSTIADLETLFQLIYLNFTQLNKDQAAFEAYINIAKSEVENKLAKPENYFKNEFNKFQHAQVERFVSAPTKADYERTNYELAYSIYKQRFANAADFNFVFVGNFDEKIFLDFAKKYLGNLATSSARETYKQRTMKSLSGDFTKKIYKGTEQKTKVEMVYRGKYDYNTKDEITFEALKEVLKIKLLERLREEESGVYSPNVRSRYFALYDSYSLKVLFECAPENAEKLIAATKAEIAKLITEGPSKTDLNKVKETLVLERKNIKNRSYFWLSAISDAAFYGKDINDVNKHDKRIKALSTKDIQEIAQKFLDKGAVVGILYPEKK